MAEANMEDDLCERFEEAANRLQSLVSTVDQATLLKLYGLYKQASVGVCDTPQPGWFQMQARRKWDAWRELGEMSRAAAMARYVEMMGAVDPGGVGGGRGWVAVSSMANRDPALADADKDIFDYVKEGDVGRVREAARGTEVSGLRDGDGMALVHWAADRGNVDMLQTLAGELGADLRVADAEGQTALHYAAACGHAGAVRYLLGKGADPDARDGEGLAPGDLASERDVRDLLTRGPES